MCHNVSADDKQRGSIRRAAAVGIGIEQAYHFYAMYTARKCSASISRVYWMHFLSVTILLAPRQAERCAQNRLQFLDMQSATTLLDSEKE